MINRTLITLTKFAVGVLVLFWILLAFTATARAEGLKNWHIVGTFLYGLQQNINDNTLRHGWAEERNQALKQWLRNSGQNVDRTTRTIDQNSNRSYR
tara:strand:+ start:5670 stop:5960 length:291 start_codon:yes stop_codon:yes gene_type:complete